MMLTACQFDIPEIEERCKLQGYKVKTDLNDPLQVNEDFNYNCIYYKRCFHKVGKPIGLNFSDCPK